MSEEDSRDELFAQWVGNHYEISQGRKPSEGHMMVHPRRYINFVEAREENILRYETALNSVPILAAAVWLRADMVTAYGHTYAFETDKELQDFQRKQLNFLRAWRRFVELDNVIQQISAQMDVFGECFVEKVYDNKSYNEGGWGIKRLKVVHPYSVSVKRDSYGRVIEYWQEPYKIKTNTGVFMGTSVAGPKTTTKSDEEMRIRKVGAETVVHFKARDITNATYGNSMFRPLKDVVNIMLGMEDDIADIIRTTARPLTVWKMGDAQNPLAVKQMKAIASQIMAGLARGSDIAIDGRVEVDTVEIGKSVTNVEPFQAYVLRQIIAGLGVPDTLIGFGSSSAPDAEIKNEMFRRRIMARQNYIGTKLLNEVFRDIFLFSPSDFQNKKNMAKVNEVPPIKYQSLPFIRWLEIESIADRRLRIESELMGGSMDMLEAREDFGRKRVIVEQNLHPTLQMQLAQSRLHDAQAEAQPDLTEAAKTQAEASKESAKNKPTPSTSPSSPK